MNDPAQEELLDARTRPAEQAAESEYVFASVVSKYETPLLRYVGGLLGADAAEDIVQEAFLRLHRHVLKNGESRVANTSSWLFRVAHNLSVDKVRKRRRQERRKEQAVHDRSAPAADKLDALGKMMQREACEKAMTELRRLPDEQKQVILLRVVEGMTLRQVGEVAGLTTGNAAYRINQGLQELARRLKASGVI